MSIESQSTKRAWATTIRFERVDDQSYMVYLGENSIGRVEKLDERDWHAMDGRQRRSFYTRADAVDWLRERSGSNAN
jgi:hypothetical protein